MPSTPAICWALSTMSNSIFRPVRTSSTCARPRVLRQRWEEQKRFPLQIATTLSQQFAGRGLQFFKVNKTVTHVAVARPHFLDLEATPVSDGVKRIVDFINATPKCTHKQLLKTLAPAPAAPVPVAPAPEAAAAVEGAWPGC